MSRLAARQHGLFTRAQFLGLGFSARQLDHGARSGRWHLMHRGVYRMAGAPTSDIQSVLAAVLAAGAGALASHRSAGWLWELVTDLRLEITGPCQRFPGGGVTVHRVRGSLPRAAIRRGVPCTDPLRTVVDLAGAGDEALVETALDRGIANALFSVAAVEAELGRRARQGLAGVTLLRACLHRRLDGGGTGPQTSALESAMDRIIVLYGLARPVRQYRLEGTPYRLDYAWPAARLVVEVDGYESHSGLEAFCHDRERQNALVLAGWTVLRFTWADVCRHPGRVAEQISRVLSASRPA